MTVLHIRWEKKFGGSSTGTYFIKVNYCVLYIMWKLIPNWWHLLKQNFVARMFVNQESYSNTVSRRGLPETTGFFVFLKCIINIIHMDTLVIRVWHWNCTLVSPDLGVDAADSGLHERLGSTHPRHPPDWHPNSTWLSKVGPLSCPFRFHSWPARSTENDNRSRQQTPATGCQTSSASGVLSSLTRSPG